MKKYLRLIFILFKYRISRNMVYSFNFWIAFFVDIILFIFHLLAFTAIYQFTDTINGWTLYQVFVFIGTFTIIDSFGMGTWFFGIINLESKIRSGSLDLIISKPVNTQFYISFDNFNPGSLFGIIVGIAMVSYGLARGGFHINVLSVMGYILLCVMMCCVFYSLMVIVRTFAFFFIKIDSLQEAENSVVEIAFRIPGPVFKGISKFIFMVVIPYGLIATAPTEFITGLFQPAKWISVGGVTLFFTSASILFFKFGLSRYSSTGS